ncbi:restriction endonuclease subunit S (plasmid) [Deinococcus sp. VB343]|uniref:Restriction endonuclease subunit S n=1 Tax=Deinococcus sp. VB142 TaxID=3112952 RepID=A0AAU6Q7P8_9DEIO
MSSKLSFGRLSDLTVPNVGVQTGPFGSQLHQEDYVPEGTPIITVEHMGENRILHENLPRVSDADKNRLNKYHLQAGDIVFSRVGSVDRRALVRDAENGWLFSGRCLRVRADPDILDATYLSYFFGLEGFKKYIRGVAVGATMPSINTQILSELPIYYPPLPIQRQIAAILSAFDDKIELNRQMNRTLEQMARALFKSWFVDFDPVRAKMRGEQPEGMDAATAALFPSELVEVDGREVPKGWEIKGLDEIADFLNGLALQKFPPTGENDLPVIKIAQLRKGNTEGSGFAARTVGEKYIVKDGDILFSWSGSLEVVRWSGGEGALNQHLFKVTSSEYPNWFIFWWLLEHLPEFQAIAANKATTMGHIQRKHLNDAKAVLPPKDLLLRLGESIYPLFESMFQNDQESARLAQLRDALLPRLLSGEVDVSEWAAPQEQGA